MEFSKYLDCELFIIGRNQARLSVAGRDYAGYPTLDKALERQLIEAALEPVRYGTLLFEALFQQKEGSDLLVGYRESQVLARHAGQLLRLRLQISNSAPFELHHLHWELLYDPGRKIALARSQETAFSRYLGVSFELGTEVVGHPRLLVVLSCPSDLGEYQLPGFDRDELRQRVQEALAPLDDLVSYEFFKGPATLQRIRDHLVANPFHALHFQAHGLLQPQRKMASLVLEDEHQRAAFIGEELFSEAFDGLRDLRLVTLVTCHSGASSNTDPFSGLGPALVRRGIPAVVAMRRQITLGAAARFTQHFYRNLARTGQIDVAMNEARLQLYLTSAEALDWSSPTLFMHLKEGLLWRTQESADSEPQSEETNSEEPELQTLVIFGWKKSPPVGIGSHHDRLVRDLLQLHGGIEVERGKDRLVLFQRPAQAVRYALAYHQALEEWSQNTAVPQTFMRMRTLLAGPTSVALGDHLSEVP